MCHHLNDQVTQISKLFDGLPKSFTDMVNVRVIVVCSQN